MSCISERFVYLINITLCKIKCLVYFTWYAWSQLHATWVVSDNTTTTNRFLRQKVENDSSKEANVIPNEVDHSEVKIV